MMRNSARKLAAVASCIVVTVGGITTGAVTANAASQDNSSPKALSAACVSRQYDKPSNYRGYPTPFPGGTWLRPSSACGRIWIYPTTNRYVKVCIAYSDTVRCPSSYTYAYANTWTELASAVSDGTQYKFLFQGSAASDGWYRG